MRSRYRIKTDVGRIDILIQNAAIYHAGSVQDAVLSDFDKQYRTNVRAPYRPDTGHAANAESTKGAGCFYQFQQRVNGKAHDSAV